MHSGLVALKQKNVGWVQPIVRRFQFARTTIQRKSRWVSPTLRDYIGIDWQIMPPLILNQAKLFMKEGDLRLAPREWKSGKHLWLIDLVTPFGNPEAVIKELREQMFPTQSIRAVLLNPKTGKLQRVEWPAVNPVNH